MPVILGFGVPALTKVFCVCAAVVVRVPYTYDDAVMRSDGQHILAPFEAAAVLSDVQVMLSPSSSCLTGCGQCPCRPQPCSTQGVQRRGSMAAADISSASCFCHMQASIFGDEFWRFVETGGGGALQRCSVAAWIDVFCAHCPENGQQQVLNCKMLFFNCAEQCLTK